MSDKKDAKGEEIKKKKMSDLQESNWFPITLLIVASILAVVNIFGYLIYPYIFSSFSVIVFTFIILLAGYVLYQIIRILREV
ncbi:MAG: hypothetical protein ACOC44_09805 [Promethearchaeia archaeon]